MAVDWDEPPEPAPPEPPPGYAEYFEHGEIDALITERNAARAEAQLWLRRLQRAQQEREEARAALRDADKCLLDWQRSHVELARRCARLEVSLSDARSSLDTARLLLRHLDPFLPTAMQDPALRAANEPAYAAIAAHIGDKA